MRFSPSLSALGTAARRRCQPGLHGRQPTAVVAAVMMTALPGPVVLAPSPTPRHQRCSFSSVSQHVFAHLCRFRCNRSPRTRSSPRPSPTPAPPTSHRPAPPRPPPKHTYCTSPTISTAGITRTDYAYSRMRRPATSRVSPLTVAGTSCVTALDHPGLSRKGDPNIDSTCRKLQPSRSSRSEFPQDA